MQQGLIIFAFSGLLPVHLLGILCRQAAEAVNCKEPIVSFLKENYRLIGGLLCRTLIIPVFCMSVCLFMVHYSICTGFLKSLLFGILLFISVTYRNIFPQPNVIPLSWSVIYGGVFAVVMYCKSLEEIFTDKSSLLFELLKTYMHFVIIVGTILGVCMTILWTMDPKNLQGLELSDKGKIDYQEINTYRGFWALYMIVLFAFIFIGISYWLALPLIETLGSDLSA